jgi:pre-rRNA-processing protein TSR3
VQDTWPQYYRGNDRRLPYLVAANPIHYGHLYELSSIEALASALFLIKHETQARRILSIYKWGPAFLSLNQDLLNEYQWAKTEEDVVEIEKNVFNI